MVVDVVGARPSGQASSAFGKASSDIGGLGERAVRPAGDRHQRNAHALGIGDDVAEFGRAAGIGEGNQPVILGDHAEIAVACLGRMDEQGRRSGGGEGGGDLAGDMAALAHAGDDHPAVDRHQQVEGSAQQTRIQARRQSIQALGFQSQNALCHS